MVKKNVIKINTKRIEIKEIIEKSIRDHSQIIKDCNTRLGEDPENDKVWRNNRKVWDWREAAFTGLNQGIMGLPYRLGQLNGLVQKLESTLHDKPAKSTQELLGFIERTKQFIATINRLHDKKKALLDDAEAKGLWEKIQF